MSRSRYKIYETEYPYFLTSSIVDGIPLFANPEIAQFILEGLQFLQESRDVDLYAYVIMENHLHFIAANHDLPEKLKTLNPLRHVESLIFSRMEITIDC